MNMNSNIKPLLIFTSEYISDPQLNRVGVANTKTLIEKAFFSEKGLNIPYENGVIISNEKYVSACAKIADFFKSVDCDNDVCLIYFCGHGFPDYEKNRVFLAMSDTDTSNWNTCGYDINNIISHIKNARIKRYIIILDCCHSGFLCDMGNGKKNTPIQIAEYEEAHGAVYLTSTTADDSCNQVSIDNKYYVPFSYYLAKTLLGNYSKNNNLQSISEIYHHVKAKLNEMNYITEPNIQTKGDFADLPFFQINKTRIVGPNNSSSFYFSEYFNTEKLNVLLVKTAINNPIKYDDFGVPLGLWMLKGYLSTTGLSLNVEVYDERLELIKCGDDKNKRKKVLEQFSDVIKGYDVIGISLSSSEVPPALEKFKIAKEQNKITFCGGIFAASNEEYLVNTGVIDYVIAGVGTVPLGNLLARLAQEKSRETLGKHIINEYGVATKEYFYLYDMPWSPTQLPTMRQSMWIEILERYRPYLGNRIDVYTARGCDKNCLFCSVQKESGQVVYRKEDACVIEEIKYLKSVGITYFSFKDENFLSKPSRMLGILKAVADDGIKFKIRARYDELLSSNISLQELHDLGVDEIQYGIESPNVHLTKQVRKGNLPLQSIGLVDFIKQHAEYNITANCSFILGINGEDANYYDNLLIFIKEIYTGKSRPKIYVNFLTPHPFNSQFPFENYSLVTKDLNFFTHKYPVCFPETSTFALRKKMLKIYDEIVEHSESQKYNPSVSNIPKELRDNFLYGKSIQDTKLY